MNEIDRLRFKSRRIFAVILTALFLASCEITQPIIESKLVGAPALQPAGQPADVLMCGKRDTIVDQLKARYAERPRSRGLAVGGAIIELLTSKSGSWTIFMTLPQGITCIVYVGEAWTTLKPVEGKML